MHGQEVEGVKNYKTYPQMYDEIKLIGRGNFGSALIVRNNEDKQLYVAKKVVLSNMEEKEKKGVLLEADLLKKINHPFIVTYKNSFLEDDMLMIVMEHCEVGDLALVLKQRKEMGANFTEKEIMTWFSEICLALSFCHSHRILHRDIKASNIFLTKNYTAKLGDFGISKVLQQTVEAAMTVVGTPYYMSPEVCQNKPYTVKSDIWSLGSLLYELCTFAHPFSSDNLLGLVYKIVKGEYDPIPAIYSSEMKDLVGKLLNKEEASRPSIIQILQYPYVKKYLQEFVESHGKHNISGEMLKRTITARNAQMRAITQIPIENKMSKLDLNKGGIPELSAKQKLAARKEENRKREIERLTKAARESAGHLYDAKQRKYNELNEQSPAAQNMYPAHPYGGASGGPRGQSGYGGAMRPQTDQNWFMRGNQAAAGESIQGGTSVDFQFGEEVEAEGEIDWNKFGPNQVEIHPPRPLSNQYYSPYNASPQQPPVGGGYRQPPLVGPTDPGNTGYNIPNIPNIPNMPNIPNIPPLLGPTGPGDTAYNIPQHNLGNNPHGFGIQMYGGAEESKDFNFGDDSLDFQFSLSDPKQVIGAGNIVNNREGLVGMSGRSHSEALEIPPPYEQPPHLETRHGSLHSSQHPTFDPKQTAYHRPAAYIDNRQLTGSNTGKYNIFEAEQEALYPDDFEIDEDGMVYAHESTSGLEAVKAILSRNSSELRADEENYRQFTEQQIKEKPLIPKPKDNIEKKKDECIRILGPTLYTQAYQYIRGSNPSDPQHQESLKRMLGQNQERLNCAFLIDEIIYMESFQSMGGGMI